MKRTLALIVIVAGCSISLPAQWPKYVESGAPRDAQGRVVIDGPSPHAPDGTPDLTGDWMRADRDPPPPQLAGLTNRGAAGVPVERQTPPFPPDPKSPPLATFWDIGANLPGGLPLTPWAAELRKNRMATNSKDKPDANCMPMGITQFHMQPQEDYPDADLDCDPVRSQLRPPLHLHRRP